MNETIEDKILSKIRKCGRGTVFFSSDFLAYGSRASVNKALERMTVAGNIIRVARGIYCYPKMDKVYGLGAIPPSDEEIAMALARKDGARIVPADAWAQYQLGLTQQVPMNYVYLTNGPSRTLEIREGCQIKFRHASPRYFTMKDPLAQMIATALKEWKVENLNEDQIGTLRSLVQKHGAFPPEDLKLMPSHVREFVLSLYQ